MEVIMSQQQLLPQNTRFMAVLLGFIGGALDVFCHMHYDVMVATQTGNIILLIANVKSQNIYDFVLRCLSIIFFSLGFIVGIFIKDRRKTAYWRAYSLLPLLITTLLLPLFDFHKYISVSLIAFVTGIMMLTFSGSLIEDHPFTILMTSGNYRKMLMAIYRLIQGKGDTAGFKRQAINYGLIVISFIIGGVLSASFSTMYKTKAVWLISTALTVMLIYYCYNIKKVDIKYTDI
jgi:putative membrane protein